VAPLIGAADRKSVLLPGDIKSEASAGQVFAAVGGKGGP
jgi:hypothetical protein